jgi:hypothetical protein
VCTGPYAAPAPARRVQPPWSMWRLQLLGVGVLLACGCSGSIQGPGHASDTDGAAPGGAAPGDAAYAGGDAAGITPAADGGVFDAALAADRGGLVPDAGGTGTAAELAAKLGKPARLLVGLGGGQDPSDITAQGITPDIHERYLVGLASTGGWTTWNSPSGAYVNIVAADADALGAVPMYTLYQMAAWGDGSLGGLGDTAFMTEYWSHVKLMFQRLAIYDRPCSRPCSRQRA